MIAKQMIFICMLCTLKLIFDRLMESGRYLLEARQTLKTAQKI